MSSLHAWINSIAISVASIALVILSLEIRLNRMRIEDLERQLHRRDKQPAAEAEQRYRGSSWEP